MPRMTSRSMPEPHEASGMTTPEWTDDVVLSTLSGHGETRDVRIRIGQPARARILLIDAGVSTEIEDSDYRNCLNVVRTRLEGEDRLLCCQGSRLNVHASGMLLQFSNGREAYLLEPRNGGEEYVVVDIFAPAPASQVTTMEKQRAWYFDFLGWSPARGE